MPRLNRLPEFRAMAAISQGAVDPAAAARVRPPLLAFGLMILGACAAPFGQGTDASTGFLKELPEEVALIAAPYQNLNEVMYRPEDGCYWYRHVGQVETTMLPLLSERGRAICTEASVKAKASVTAKPPAT